MKSRLINTVCAIGQRLPLRFSRSLPRLSQTGMALGGAVCVLTLSGCYYPVRLLSGRRLSILRHGARSRYPAGGAGRARRFLRRATTAATTGADGPARPAPDLRGRRPARLCGAALSRLLPAAGLSRLLRLSGLVWTIGLDRLRLRWLLLRPRWMGRSRPLALTPAGAVQVPDLHSVRSHGRLRPCGACTASRSACRAAQPAQDAQDALPAPIRIARSFPS
jgi:hypothetical protein